MCSADGAQALRRRGVERQVALDHFLELAVIQRRLRRDQHASQLKDALDGLLDGQLVDGANIPRPLHTGFSLRHGNALLGGMRKAIKTREQDRCREMMIARIEARLGSVWTVSVGAGAGCLSLDPTKSLRRFIASST